MIGRDSCLSDVGKAARRLGLGLSQLQLQRSDRVHQYHQPQPVRPPFIMLGFRKTQRKINRGNQRKADLDHNQDSSDDAKNNKDDEGDDDDDDDVQSRIARFKQSKDSRAKKAGKAMTSSSVADAASNKKKGGATLLSFGDDGKQQHL